LFKSRKNLDSASLRLAGFRNEFFSLSYYTIQLCFGEELTTFYNIRFRLFLQKSVGQRSCWTTPPIYYPCLGKHTPSPRHSHKASVLWCSKTVNNHQHELTGHLILCSNASTSRDDFIFYSKRLMRLLFEFALSLLPHVDHVVATPQGTTYEGRKFSGNGVSYW